jgi:hypothetical protein
MQLAARDDLRANTIPLRSNMEALRAEDVRGLNNLEILRRCFRDDFRFVLCVDRDLNVPARVLFQGIQ